MYGEEITPNQHKLARQFGVLDNFYDSGEVSGDGHVWSNAAITSDYTEKTWQQSYRGKERVYDYEGVVENGYPLRKEFRMSMNRGSGYLWTNLARHGKTLSPLCGIHFDHVLRRARDLAPQQSPDRGDAGTGRRQCGAHGDIRHGEAIPQNYGGGTSPYPWPIPLINENVATKPELVGHFDPQYPDFELSFPDQLRVEEFLTHFRQVGRGTAAGARHDAAVHPAAPPQRPHCGHHSGNADAQGLGCGQRSGRGTRGRGDLPQPVLGRHRVLHPGRRCAERGRPCRCSSQRGPGGEQVRAPRARSRKWISTFYTTVSVIRTMEELLGLPPMNNNDAFAPPIASLFAGAGDQPAYDADYRNRDNGLLYQANGPKAPGAKASSKMDFQHEDRADPRMLNVILWKDAMGKKPVPARCWCRRSTTRR